MGHKWRADLISICFFLDLFWCSIARCCGKEFVRAVNEWRDRDASGGGGAGADGSGPKAAARSVTAAQRLAAQLEAEREEMSLRIRQQKEEAEQRLRQVRRHIFLLCYSVL
jgi:hypothetical protein